MERNPKEYDADVVDIDPREYDDLVENYTEEDLDELFLAYGVDLSNYDDVDSKKKTSVWIKPTKYLWRLRTVY